MNTILKSLAEIGAIAENDLDEEELRLLIRNLDYLGRFCGQRLAALRAREHGKISEALRHEANAQSNYQMLSPEARW